MCTAKKVEKPCLTVIFAIIFSLQHFSLKYLFYSVLIIDTNINN